MKITDWTGFILPIGSAILSSLVLSGITWAGYVLIPAITVIISVELVITWVIYRRKEYVDIDIIGATVEVIMYCLTAVMLLASGWVILAGAYTFSTVLDAINVVAGAGS